jgi:hypothetical protein
VRDKLLTMVGRVGAYFSLSTKKSTPGGEGVRRWKGAAFSVLALVLMGGASLSREAHAQQQHNQTPTNALVFMRAVIDAGGVSYRRLNPATAQPEGDWLAASETWEASSDCVLGFNTPNESPMALDLTFIEIVVRTEAVALFAGRDRYELRFPSPDRAARFAWAAEVLRRSCDPANGLGF